jgi:hypothetical protein
MSEHQKTHQNTQPQKPGKVSKSEGNPRQKIDPQQMMDAPETLQPEDVLNAQQVLGNQVVQRALEGDPRREDSTDEQGNLLPEISDKINQARGGGSPLPSDIQNEAGKTLGVNFKDVRLHTGEEADAISRRISARAFTIGKDIFFKKGAYAPGSSQGRETLIHELTHVKQQSGSRGGGMLKLGERGSAMEQQADQIGKQAAQGIGKSASQVQRMSVEEEELQMQSDEEEELLQMQEEEEELQMQAEEDELQMQPDPIVQRDGDDDDWETGDDKKEEPGMISPQQMQSLGGQLLKQLAKKPSSEKKPNAEPSSKVDNEGPEDEDPSTMSPRKRLEKGLAEREAPYKGEQFNEKSKAAKGQALKGISDKASSMKSKDQSDRLKALDDKGQANLKKNYLAEQKAGTSGFLNQSIAKKKSEEAAQAKEKSVTDTKDKWVKTLSDPNASKEDIDKAKKRLDTLHKGKMKDKDYKEAKKQRQAALEDAARAGDDKAFEKMEAEKAAEEEEKKKNPSKAKKFGSFMAKAGLGVAKGIGGIIADQGKDGLKHFLGVDPDKDDDDEDDEKDEKDKKSKKKGGKDKGKSSGDNGGSGSGAVGTIMEKYAEVVEENKKLKAQLENKEGK